MEKGTPEEGMAKLMDEIVLRLLFHGIRGSP